jgi:hypothetical protein
MQGAWRGTKAQRELPEPSAPKINEINQRLRVEATTRIELVYTVLQFAEACTYLFAFISLQLILLSFPGAFRSDDTALSCPVFSSWVAKW